MVKSKRATTAIAAAVLMASASAEAAHATALTPGDILVARVVGGSVAAGATPGTVAPITNYTIPTNGGAAATVEIDEYAPGNFSTPVMSITLPNVQQTTVNATGLTTYALTMSGTQVQEGSLLSSYNGAAFSIAGYNQTAGVAGTNASNSTVVQRVVGLLSLNGAVDTTTGLTDAVSAVSFRSAYTSDGTNIWVNGATKAANSFSGVHYTTVGSTTSTQITAQDTNATSDILGAYNPGTGPQLVLSSLKAGNQASPPAAATFTGIATVGTGFPTSGSNTTFPVQFAGFSNTSAPSNTTLQTLINGEVADNYWFQNATTLFIADNRNNMTVANTTTGWGGFGGVQKWVEQDTDGDGKPDTWVFQYNITLGLGETATGSQTGPAVGAHALAGTVDPKTGLANLYVTTFDQSVQSYTGTDGTTAITGLSGSNRNDLYEVQDTGTGFTIANNGSPLAVSGAGDGSHGIVGTADSAFRGVSIVPNFIMGDADLNGKVDMNDLNTVLNNFGKATTSWTNGNFDGNATIDLTDLADVLNNFGQTLGGTSITAQPLAATPEPASLALFGLGVVGVLVRRRRA